MSALDFDKLIGNEDTFALDISNTRVKVMWVVSAGRNSLKLQSYGEEKIPASAVVGGIIRRPDVVAKAINKILKNTYPKSIKTNYAICSIPQEKVYLKVEDFPNLEKEKLKEAVTWKAKSILAMPLEKIYWDWHRLNPNSEDATVSIQFAAVEKEVIDSYVNAIESAGIVPLAFEMESSAAVRTILASNDKLDESPVLYIDMGNSNTNFSIYHRGGFRFNSSVNVGGKQLAKIIGTEKNLNPADSEEYLRNIGLKTKTESLNLSLDTALQPITTEIMGAIRFYDKTAGESDDIKKIYIYGDGAYLKNIDKYIAAKFPEVSVEYANPSVKMVPLPQFISHEKIFPHVVVTGLAVKGLDIYKGFEDINFLPQSVQKSYVDEQLRKKIGNITKIFFINIIAICGFLLGGLFLLDEESKQIQATIDSKNSILSGQSLQSKSDSISDFNDSLESISSIISSEFDWIKILESITYATPSNVTLKTLDIYLDESQGSKSEPVWIINLHGVTSDRQTVINYSNNLIEEEIFQDVSIPVSSFSSSDDVTFRIDMNVLFTDLLKDSTGFTQHSESSQSSELELRPFNAE